MSELKPVSRTSPVAQCVEISHILQIRWLQAVDKSPTTTMCGLQQLIHDRIRAARRRTTANLATIIWASTDERRPPGRTSGPSAKSCSAHHRRSRLKPGSNSPTAERRRQRQRQRRWPTTTTNISASTQRILSRWTEHAQPQRQASVFFGVVSHSTSMKPRIVADSFTFFTAQCYA